MGWRLRAGERPVTRAAPRRRAWAAGGAWTLVLGAATASLAWATDNFTAFTTDGARAARVARAPVAVPAVLAFDAQDRPVRLVDSGAATILDFVSTQCAGVCRAQGAVFRQLQQMIGAHRERSRVRLRTVSFDPADDAARLASWGDAFGADPAVWQVTRLDAADRARVLATFGITTVRDPVSGWRHNTALHVISPDGRLVRVLPVDAVAEAIEAAVATLPARAP